jgi:hypothetical protein
MRGLLFIFALLISGCTIVNSHGNIKRTHIVAAEDQIELTIEAQRCPVIEFDVIADVEGDEEGTVQVYEGRVVCKTLAK